MTIPEPEHRHSNSVIVDIPCVRVQSWGNYRAPALTAIKAEGQFPRVPSYITSLIRRHWYSGFSRRAGRASSGAGEHFLLDTGTLFVSGYYREIPAVSVWNGPLPTTG